MNNRKALVAQGLIAAVFAVLAVASLVLILLAVFLGKGSGLDRVYRVFGESYNIYFAAQAAIFAVPFAGVALWRLLQLLGRAQPNEAVAWTNRLVAWTGVAILAFGGGVVPAWDYIVTGGNGPVLTKDTEIDFPTLPLEVKPDTGWEVTDLEGKTINVAELKGKVVFINHWATWCGYCKWEFPNLQRLNDHFRDNPEVAFLFVTKEDPEVVKKWMASEEAKGVNLPFYIAKEIPERFEPDGYPTTYIVAPDGRTAFQHSGFVAWDGERTKAFLAQLAAQ